jgi:hypothetical protein
LENAGIRLDDFVNLKVILNIPNAFFKIKPINPLNAELNPICYLPALLGDQHFLHVSRIRVNNQLRSSEHTLYKILRNKLEQIHNID